MVLRFFFQIVRWRKHSSFSTLSTLITVSSFQRAQVRFSTKNGGTKPGLHRLPGRIALAKFASIQRLTVAVRPVPHGESHHPIASRKSDGNANDSDGLHCTTNATPNVEFFVAPVDCQSLSVPKCCPIDLSVWTNGSWAPVSDKLSPSMTVNPMHLAPEK